jgi:secondary thiamine-phosphate synthase enzyme
MRSITISTRQATELVDITQTIQSVLDEMEAASGVMCLFCPHTTAGLTLNENWDPDVKHDLLLTLDEHIAPPDKRHRHGEGNSPAHIKSSLVGASQIVLVEGGRLQLGQWQGIYLAEFDGPRRRQVWLQWIGC